MKILIITVILRTINSKKVRNYVKILRKTIYKTPLKITNLSQKLNLNNFNTNNALKKLKYLRTWKVIKKIIMSENREAISLKHYKNKNKNKKNFKSKLNHQNQWKDKMRKIA